MSFKFISLPVLTVLVLGLACFTVAADTLTFKENPASGINQNHGEPADTDTDEQGAVSVGRFLSTALDDPNLSFHDERIDVLKNTQGGIPFIEDPELRVTIDKFESRGQKYALRVKPMGLDEIREGRALRDAMVRSEMTELDASLHQALKNRYMAVVDSIYVSEMTRLQEDVNLLFQDWEHVLRRQADTPDFDAGELADMETRKAAFQIDIMELDNLGDKLSQRVRLLNGSQDVLDLNASAILSVELMADRILALDNNGKDENVHLTRARTRMEKADASYNLEEAREHGFITFIEGAYNTDDEDGFDDAFSIEFGFSIPIGSGSKEKLMQKKMAQMESRSRRRILEREIDQAVPVIRKKLSGLIGQYIDVGRQEKNSFSRAAFNRLLHTGGADPLTLLKLRKCMLETRILQVKLSRMIFTAYVDFLDITGKLSEKPLINHLAAEERKELAR